MTRALALILTAATACTPATMRRGLHYAAGATEVLAQGSLACDAGSTRWAVEGPGAGKFMETNAIMGDHPTGRNVATYFAASIVVTAGANRVLPDILRIAGNLVLIGVEYDAVSSNTSVGVPLCGL
jgi:hypothetical protein